MQAGDVIGGLRATRKIQVDGVGTTRTGCMVRLKDTQSKDAAVHNIDWQEELGNGTKVIKPRYGLMLHRIPTGASTCPKTRSRRSS